MSHITDIAKRFFEACEIGRGWEVCKQWCRPDATLSTDAEHFAEVRSLEQYTERMKNLFNFITDGRYELRSLATDEEGKNVSAYAVFMGTHTGQGGPCPPTGKALKADYVYVMFFDADKIKHMQKIWDAGLVLRQLGWA